MSDPLGWAVWYPAFHVTSADTRIEDVQAFDVQAIVYYEWVEGDIRRRVVCGILDHETYEFFGRTLHGSYMTDEGYAALKMRVHEDQWRPSL